MIGNRNKGYFKSFTDFDIDGQYDMRSFWDGDTKQSSLHVFVEGKWLKVHRVNRERLEADQKESSKKLKFVVGKGWVEMD